MNKRDLTDLLLGKWRYERVITGGATASGTVTFQAVGEHRLRYFENGTLVLATGEKLAASRSYIYEPDEDALNILFDEDPLRLFHRIALSKDAEVGFHGAGEHLCGNDLYVSNYAIAPETITIEHAVKGPKKDYVSVTTLMRTARPANQ